MNSYKKIKSLEQRKRESDKIFQKHKIKIPVIVLMDPKMKSCKSYYKFLVSGDINVSNLQFIIRHKIKIDSSKAIFCITDRNTLLCGNSTMCEIYAQNKDKEDNMLYLNIKFENTFGYTVDELSRNPCSSN